MAPFSVAELASLSVEMTRLVSVGDLLVGAGQQPVYLLAEEVTSISDADMAITVDPPLVRDRRTVPVRLSGFDVPDYLVVEGRPRARDGFWAVAAPLVTVGAPTELEPFPEPRNVPVEVTARWLPLAATLNPAHTVWAPWSETILTADGYTVAELAAFNVGEVGVYRVKDLLATGTIIVDPSSGVRFQTSTGAIPSLREKFSYWRGGSMVRNGSIGMDGGQYYWTDDVQWSTPEVTVIVVAVLRQPRGEWYSILETAHPDPAVLSPAFSLRYSRSGTLALWSDQVLAQMDLSTGVNRPAQPVVVGFNMDMARNKATLMSVDTGVQMTEVTMPTRVDPVSRLVLGRSPLGSQAGAVMDVLEVAYSTEQYSLGNLHKLMAVYDRIYGVSSS